MPRLIFMRLDIIIQDERAHKFSLHCKGIGGHKVCFLCQNVCNHWSSYLRSDTTGFLVSSHEVDVSKFVLQTNASIKGIQRRLKEVSGDSAQLKDLQIKFGFNFVPTSLLQDFDLDVQAADVVNWDWMHIYFFEGVALIELRALMSNLGVHNLGGKRFHDYLQHWAWPAGYSHGKGVRGKHKDNSPGGTASELMSCFPVLAK
eukprot:3856393-Pyramimonas_sp.AAC.1